MCDRMAVLANYGTYPDWSPYMGERVADGDHPKQHNRWHDNVYVGPWTFVAHDPSGELDFQAVAGRAVPAGRGQHLPRRGRWLRCGRSTRTAGRRSSGRPGGCWSSTRSAPPGAKTIVPLPRSLIQMVTMGALVAAFALALTVNPRLRVRPSAFVFLLSLLLVPSVISSVDLESGFGAVFRCARLALFVGHAVAAQPLVGRRHHLRPAPHPAGTSWCCARWPPARCMSPGAALPELYGGRLVGALWPLTPPQIGQYAAVIIGLAVLLVLGRADRRAQRGAGRSCRRWCCSR